MNRALTIVLLAILAAGPLSAQAPLDLMMRVDRSNNAADPEMYVDYSADPDDGPRGHCHGGSRTGSRWSRAQP